MSNKTVLLLVAIFVLVGGAIFLLPSDEKEITNNLTSIAEYCSTARNDSVMETLRKVTLASKLFVDPSTIEIQSRNFNATLNPKEVSDHILMLKKRLPNTIFTFEDISINILTDDSADVLTTLHINGQSNNGQFRDAYEVEIKAIKMDGDWLFSSFTVVEFMKK
jgi:hypothetical protein